MSLNQSFAMDPKKIQSKGKLFGSIDFEPLEGVTQGTFNLTNRGTVIGHLYIGNSKFPVTLSELDRISETCNNAGEIIFKKYRLNLP